MCVFRCRGHLNVREVLVRAQRKSAPVVSASETGRRTRLRGCGAAGHAALLPRGPGRVAGGSPRRDGAGARTAYARRPLCGIRRGSDLRFSGGYV